jgi:hypothetical protein
MHYWIMRMLVIVITVAVGILALTALPFWVDEHMEGQRLKNHMLASGALVVGLPLLAIFGMPGASRQAASVAVHQLGYWLLILTGLVTMTTMFLCMLQVPSTEQMHQLIEVHGYAGFATVPAVVLLIVGMVRSRRIQATRSATPG